MDNLNGKNTILIVDDEPVVLKVATMMIKKLNYDIQELTFNFNN